MKKMALGAGLMLGALALGLVRLSHDSNPSPSPAQTVQSILPTAASTADQTAATPGKAAEAVARPRASFADRPQAPRIVPASLAQVLPDLATPPADWRTFVPDKIVVCPLPNLPIEFTLKRTATKPWRTIWSGDNGTPGVTLDASGTRDRWDAIVTIPGAIEYNIEITSAGVRILEKYFGEEVCGTTEATLRQSSPQPEESAQNGSAPQAAADTAMLTSDLLVLYTTAAKNSLGGSDAVANRTSAQIAAANTYLAQSEVANIAWRLVGVVEAPGYSETGDLGDDLSNLSSSRTTLGSFAAQQRNQYGADQVMLVVDGSNDNLAGIALTPGSFSVIRRSVSAATAAHELGHNFGCHHDRQEEKAADNDGRYYYGHRYNALGRDTGTIMSYAAFRVPYYSNPDLTYEGNVLGVPAG